MGVSMIYRNGFRRGFLLVFKRDFRRSMTSTILYFQNPLGKQCLRQAQSAALHSFASLRNSKLNIFFILMVFW